MWFDFIGKSDPPNPSASAKDLQKERDLDALFKDPLKLPPHLQHHERRASRVDVDVRKNFIYLYLFLCTTMFVLDSVRRFADRFFSVLSLHPPKLYPVLQ